MTHGLLAALLLSGLVVTALTGPMVLRSAAPRLMWTPRLAVGLLLSGVIAWVLTLLAVGPVLAWGLTGPDVLPPSAARVCQQCLVAANPFGGRTLNTGVPVVLLLVVPVVLALISLGDCAGLLRRRRRATRRSAHRFGARARRREIHGHDVLLVADPHPFALSLPQRHGGIVVSTGAVESLAADELRAVLAHERAHIRQQHHLITALVDGLTARLRWVPLLGASADALGHYLEIAADDHARRVAGTPALASALLVLGAAGPAVDAAHRADGVLHALGPDRIRHLVQPARGSAGVVATVAGVAGLFALTVLAATVHMPYVLVVLSGCV